jgi:hypothetical protein
VEVVQIAGIRQGIEGENTIVGVFAEHVADEVGADESGRAGDEQTFHVFPLR